MSKPGLGRLKHYFVTHAANPTGVDSIRVSVQPASFAIRFISSSGYARLISIPRNVGHHDFAVEPAHTPAVDILPQLLNRNISPHIDQQRRPARLQNAQHLAHRLHRFWKFLNAARHTTKSTLSFLTGSSAAFPCINTALTPASAAFFRAILTNVLLMSTA